MMWHLRSRRAAPRLALAATVLAALAAGFSAEWLDFRALRVPLLLLVGLGVLAGTWALARPRSTSAVIGIGAVTGVLTWAAAEAVYCAVHVALGGRFHAERFGPQPAQASALIALHGLLLGAPTGIAAGTALLLGRRFSGATPAPARREGAGRAAPTT